MLGGVDDEGDFDPDRDVDDAFDDVADELPAVECERRGEGLDGSRCVGAVFDPLVPDAAGDDPSELSVRAVRIASTSTTMTDAAKASRRRQYTDGERSPTGRNISRTP